MASTIKVNNIQNQCGANIANKCGTTITLGASGDTITLASGASQTGFGRTGTVDWDTTAKTASFTAVSGTGYFVNTTSGAITVTLPAGSGGSIVSLKDYANTWNTNNVTVTPNGTDKINGINDSATLSTQDQSVTLVYVDSTKGWRAVQDSTSDVSGATFIVATGGTVTCCGDYKIHTFTSPGTFCVSCAGNAAGSNTVDYLVVAGGGGAGGSFCGSWGGAGGGGAGGYRESSGTASGSYTVSPLGACVSGLPLTITGYPITVGGGGSGSGNNTGCRGSNSIFSTITSTGGGGGRGSSPTRTDANSPGGSGGGGTSPQAASVGTGNTPPVSPPQGNPGGTSPGPVGAPGYGSGGGGGATQPGALAAPPGPAAGGNGATTSINATPTTYSGGGGGGTAPGTSAGTGGTGGGGNGTSGGDGNNGTTNTGGGGGGAGGTGPSTPRLGGSGGSGIVIIRYKYQ
jgi:hypothetical protein